MGSVSHSAASPRAIIGTRYCGLTRARPSSPRLTTTTPVRLHQGTARTKPLLGMSHTAHLALSHESRALISRTVAEAEAGPRALDTASRYGSTWRTDGSRRSVTRLSPPPSSRPPAEAPPFPDVRRALSPPAPHPRSRRAPTVLPPPPPVRRERERGGVVRAVPPPAPRRPFHPRPHPTLRVFESPPPCPCPRPPAMPTAPARALAGAQQLIARCAAAAAARSSPA